eukprot:m.16314 g.16314  ORF g.16314 m.16314 type:complete len:50 (-) comp10561_c0_seq17:979-1128(-)
MQKPSAVGSKHDLQAVQQELNQLQRTIRERYNLKNQVVEHLSLPPLTST